MVYIVAAEGAMWAAPWTVSRYQIRIVIIFLHKIKDLNPCQYHRLPRYHHQHAVCRQHIPARICHLWRS